MQSISLQCLLTSILFVNTYFLRIKTALHLELQIISQKEERLDHNQLQTRKMDLIKQTRVRFSGVGLEEKEAIDTPVDRKIPLQKTQSFKGDRKRSQNWFKRQFSRPMGEDSDSNYGEEYATAVAAAAFALTSLEDSVLVDSKKKDKSEKNIAKAATDKKMPEKVMGPTPSINNTPAFADKQITTGVKLPEKTVGSGPSIKKSPTFPKKTPNTTFITKKGESSAPKLDLPTTAKPAVPQSKTTRLVSIRAVTGETKADAWEKAELAKIKERHEKLLSTIQTWENKKAEKVKRQKKRRESELEQKRARNSQRHRIDMENISSIAGGARAQAEENRRNEELKVYQKAKKMRVTGKSPTTCLCF